MCVYTCIQHFPSFIDHSMCFYTVSQIQLFTHIPQFLAYAGFFPLVYHTHTCYVYAFGRRFYPKRLTGRQVG